MKPGSIASTPWACDIWDEVEVHAIPDPPAQARAGWVTNKPVGSAGMAMISRTGQLRGTFNFSNMKAMREELEIAFISINGSMFRGSVTQQEAKNTRTDLDSRTCQTLTALGRYKSEPVIIFKFKMAINVDDLIPYQHFDFKRKSLRQSRTHIDTISCAIQWLRRPEKNVATALP
jgi:hypothetical protein